MNGPLRGPKIFRLRVFRFGGPAEVISDVGEGSFPHAHPINLQSTFSHTRKDVKRAKILAKIF
jgi:hypothetical protein